MKAADIIEAVGRGIVAMDPRDRQVLFIAFVLSPWLEHARPTEAEFGDLVSCAYGLTKPDGWKTAVLELADKIREREKAAAESE